MNKGCFTFWGGLGLRLMIGADRYFILSDGAPAAFGMASSFEYSRSIHETAGRLSCCQADRNDSRWGNRILSYQWDKPNFLEAPPVILTAGTLNSCSAFA